MFRLQVWRVGAEEVGFTGDSLGLRVGDGEKGYIGGIRVGARQVTHVVRYQLLRLLLCPFMSFLRPIEASLIYSGTDTPTSAQYVADTSHAHTSLYASLPSLPFSNCGRLFLFTLICDGCPFHPLIHVSSFCSYTPQRPDFTSNDTLLSCVGIVLFYLTHPIHPLS